MSCPPERDWALFASGVQDSGRAMRMRGHADACPQCQARLRQWLDDEHDLKAMLASESRRHSRERAVLLAALETEPEPLPARRTPRRLAVILTAAAAVVTALILLPDQNNAFATAIDRLGRAESIVCRVTTWSAPPHGIEGETFLFSEEELWLSASGASRWDTQIQGRPLQSVCTSASGRTVILNPNEQTFSVTEASPSPLVLPLDTQAPGVHFLAIGSDPERLLRGVAELSTEPDGELGRRTIGGREAVGFEIAGDRVGMGPPWVDQDRRNRAEVWVEEATGDPLRLVFEFVLSVPEASGGAVVVRKVYDQFQWDVALTDDRFDPPIPDGWTSADSVPVPPMAPGEADLLGSLRLYAKITSRYPASLNLLSLSAEVAAMTVRGEDGGLGADSSALVGLGFFTTLELEGREPQYFGAHVGPDDADAVLLRWSLGEGKTRVVLGDLSTATWDH